MTQLPNQPAQPTQESPEEIRARIENTRQNLSSDVDTLAETVRPGHVARRQASRVREAAASARDRVMGTADTAKEKVMGTTSSTLGDARTGVQGAAASAQQTVAAAPGQVRARTEGNPLAAGLIAFGAGLLLGSLLPATRSEEKVATVLKEHASPVTEPVTEAAREVGEHLREGATESAGQVRSTAQEAAQTVRAEAGSAGQDVKEEGVRAGQQVRESRS